MVIFAVSPERFQQVLCEIYVDNVLVITKPSWIYGAWLQLHLCTQRTAIFAILFWARLFLRWGFLDFFTDWHVHRFMWALLLLNEGSFVHYLLQRKPKFCLFQRFLLKREAIIHSKTNVVNRWLGGTLLGRFSC